MIILFINSIIDVIFGVASFFVNIFPDHSDFWLFDIFLNNPLTWLARLVSYASYFLPMDTIINFISFSITLDLARLSIAIAVRVKSFIPLMGGS